MSLSAQKRTYRAAGPDLFLVIILTLLPCLFFWRLITPNPADRQQIVAGDFTEQYFPLRAFTAEEWVRGRLPLWNPYLYGGQPALADIQSGALYPPHILQALLLGWGGTWLGLQIGFPLQALEWQVILHFAIAAVGTYLFVRDLGPKSGFPLRRARFGALIASLVFTYSGYLTGFPVQQLTILQASAWLPWLLWSLGRGFGVWEFGSKEAEEPGGNLPVTQYVLRNTHYLCLSALFFALAILAGHPQTVLYIFYISLAYSLFFGFWTWHVNVARQEERIESGKLARGRRLLRSLATYLLVWFVAILLGAALTAAQLLPTLEFIAHSVRAELSYPAVSAGLPLTELIAVIYPGFFGGSPEYVGIATLVLVALALTLAWSAWLQKGSLVPKLRLGTRESFSLAQISFWAGAGLISLLLAFGGNLFVYPLFYLLAPGFDAVRQQERAFFIYSFSAALIAGYGAMFLTGPLARESRRTSALFERRLRLVALIALALAGFYIYGATAATARGVEVNLFYGVLTHHLFGLLILVGMLAAIALRPRRWLRRGWGMAFLAAWVAFNLFTVNWRFNLEQREPPTPFVPDGVTQFLQAHLADSLGRVASGGLLPGGNSAASVYHLQDLTGNTPLHLAEVERFLAQMPAWRLWQLLNVRYIVAEQDIADAGLQLVFAEEERKVFQMGDPFERAWLVSTVEVIPDDQQALTRLAADTFDIRQAAVVDAPLETPLADASTSKATITVFSPTSLTIMVNATGPHLLVLSQIYYPGWQASLDGQPVELRRVNLVQQGVLVPAGNHQVQLVFWPESLAGGLLISIVALVVCGLGLLYPLWFSRHRGDGQGDSSGENVSRLEGSGGGAAR